MVIRDDMGLEDFSQNRGEMAQLNHMDGELGFSLRKTLKKIAPHNLIKKISPVQAIRRAISKPKHKGGGAPASPEAAAAAAAPPSSGSPTPIPGGFMVEGNDPSGNYIAYYFPDAASANAYNQQLQAGGGYGVVSATPGGAAPGGAPAPGGYPEYGQPSYGGGAPSGGGAPAPYGPSASDQSPYADEGAPEGGDEGGDDGGEEGDEGESAPAADTGKKKLPMAPKVPSPVSPTVAPTMLDEGIPTWVWIGGAALLLGGGAYYYMKKKGII